MITISRTESVYPGSLDTFVHATTDFNPGDAVPSSDFEKLLDAVKKIETELGTDPAGASTDLVTRLAAVTAAEFGEVANIGATTISAAQWGYLGACGAGGGQLLAALTTGESDQLELIGATTISAAQWGYLGTFDTTAKARAYPSGNQLNLVDGAWTKVVLDSESYDPGTNFDAVTNYRFVVPTTGWYLIHGAVHFINTVADKLYSVCVSSTTAPIPIAINMRDFATAENQSVITSTVQYLAADSSVYLYVKSDAGNNTVDIFGNSIYTYLEVCFISP